MSAASSARLMPQYEFPPYTYVPGCTPHPKSDPKGHGCHCPSPIPSTLAMDAEKVPEAHLWAVDLFNHGYYWEAHEVWEDLWIVAGRNGVLADFFKALIKLAAAGVKWRQALAEGVQGHARRASEIFLGVRGALNGRQLLLGLDLEQLEREAALFTTGCQKWNKLLESSDLMPIALQFDPS